MVRRSLAGILSMAGGALAFATMAALIKVACKGVPIFEVVAVRGAIGWAVLAGVEVAATGRVVGGVDRRRLFVRSLSGFVGIATYVWAIANIDLGVASALNQSSPVFVAILSAVVLRERPPRAVPLLVLVAAVGAWLIVAPDVKAIDWNAVVGLVSAASAGYAYVLVRELRKTDSPWVIIRWFSAWSVVLSLPFLPTLGFVVPNGEEALALVGMAVFGLAGQVGMTFAYRLEEASIVSPFMYVSVVGSLAYGWFVWGEWPGTTALAGCGLIVAASLAIGWVSSRRARATP